MVFIVIVAVVVKRHLCYCCGCCFCVIFVTVLAVVLASLLFLWLLFSHYFCYWCRRCSVCQVGLQVGFGSVRKKSHRGVLGSVLFFSGFVSQTSLSLYQSLSLSLSIAFNRSLFLGLTVPMSRHIRKTSVFVSLSLCLAMYLSVSLAFFVLLCSSHSLSVLCAFVFVFFLYGPFPRFLSLSLSLSILALSLYPCLSVCLSVCHPVWFISCFAWFLLLFCVCSSWRSIPFFFLGFLVLFLWSCPSVSSHLSVVLLVKRNSGLGWVGGVFLVRDALLLSHCVALVLHSTCVEGVRNSGRGDLGQTWFLEICRCHKCFI